MHRLIRVVLCLGLKLSYLGTLFEREGGPAGLLRCCDVCEVIISVELIACNFIVLGRMWRTEIDNDEIGVQNQGILNQ